MAQPVPEYIDFPKEEEKILKFWKDTQAFKTSLQQSKGRPRFSFYDGPPFATGLPHYGHILAGTIKDIVTRFAHQSGYHVERRFGWDCHGLPVEYEIDKTFDIKGPSDVEKMGIEAYNNECRKIVMRYAKQWEEVVGRMGRWIDFENDYKTLYPSFMESVWWVFKQLYNKGFVYRGVKVMPFSTACSTPLSNFESGQNYKEVTDPAVIVSFPLDDSPEISLIAWTTTPWTLPSNLSVCVNPDLDYVTVRDNTTSKVYIMMEARLEALFKKDDEYTVLDRFKGQRLRGKRYKPLFPYFEHLKAKGAFQVLCDAYVTEESGTGVVHQAPYFGEDDYRVCLSHGVLTKDQEIICPVDFSGKFTAEVTDFCGLYVKDADKHIIKYLKSIERLVHHGTTKHSYPFCWRSETPLIYRAVPSWFIRVEHMADKLLKANQDTYWVPEFVKEKRFANWLKDAHDWAVSRNRYWGTPIPLWISDDSEEVVCIGSIKELENLTGQKINDIHREVIDKLTIPSKMGKGPLKRVSEVFDCWFESGSMPYAQVHYPFEGKKEFEDSFPADFIAEGVDQTRGWFYTLLVLSTALFGKAPFKNLIVNGLVLASDGQKMSKRKKNYPDPVDVVNKFGADALRLYLINSPVVRAENLRFREEGVRDVLKDVFLPWYNAYRFLVQNVDLYEKEWKTEFRYCESSHKKSENVMDCWILSFTQSLLIFVKQEMQAYRLYTVVPRLVKFVDHLTNWFVRMNRKRLKGEGSETDCRAALETLFSVLFSMIRMMAPFTPFLTELMYQNLKNLLKESETQENANSIHFLFLPEPQDHLIDKEVERKVSRMQTAVEVGRLMRDRKTLPIKYPLPELIVIHEDPEYLNDIVSLEKYVVEELNVKKLTVTTEKHKYGVQLRAEPDIKQLGIRLRSESKAIGQAIRELSNEELQGYVRTGSINVRGYDLGEGDIRLFHTFSGEGATELSQKYEAHAEEGVLVLLDVSPDQSMVDEGVAREVINRIQKLRKKAHLVPSDPIIAFIDVNPATDNLRQVIEEYKDFIVNTLKVPLHFLPLPAGAEVIIKETTQVKSAQLEMVLIARKESLIIENVHKEKQSPVHAQREKISCDKTDRSRVKVDGRKKLKTDDANDILKRSNGPEPFCKFVNVILCNAEPQLGATSSRGTVLLENPIGDFCLSRDVLCKQIQVVFGLPGKKLKLFLTQDKLQELGNLSAEEVLKLHSHTLYVYVN